MTLTPTRPPRTRTSHRVGWTWVALSSLAIAVYAVTPYVTTPLHQLAGDSVGLAAAYEGKPAWARAAFFIHIAAGGLALVLGPLQFWRALRAACAARPPGRRPDVPVRRARGRHRDAPGARADELGRRRRVLRLRRAGRAVDLDRVAGLPRDPRRRRRRPRGLDAAQRRADLHGGDAAALGRRAGRGAVAVGRHRCGRRCRLHQRLRRGPLPRLAPQPGGGGAAGPPPRLPALRIVSTAPEDRGYARSEAGER